MSSRFHASLERPLASAVARHADVALFVTGAVLKGYYLARIFGMSERMAHFSNLLLLAVAASLALFLPPRWRPWGLALAAGLLSVLLFGDALHYRYFGEMLGAHELAYASQLADIRASIASLPRWTDIVFFLDAPLWAALLWRWRDFPLAFGVWRLAFGVMPAAGAEQATAIDSLYGDSEAAVRGQTPNAERRTPNAKRALAFKLGVLAIGLTLYAGNVAAFLRSPAAKFAYGETRRGTSYLPVVKRGIYNYHLLDAALFFRDRFARTTNSAAEIAEVERWFIGRREAGREVLPFGVARGKNLINIQLESFEDFVVGLEIAGQPITPNLNKLAREAHHFTRFLSQACEGHSSDAEFAVMNSLLPVLQGAVVQRYQGNSFHALPAILQRHGYHTFAAHALDAGFWNMRRMHRRYGFEKGYYRDELLEPGEDPWKTPDHRFFDLALPLLKNAPRPFFAHLLTLTSHEPYRQIPPEHRTLKLGALRGTRLGNYLDSVHYVDWALGRLFADLRTAGLYDSSVIVLYGDHEGLPYEEVARLGGLDGSQIDRRLRGRVPLFVVVPGARAADTLHDPCATIDVAPTLLHLLGISEPGAVFLGTNLFRERQAPLGYLRRGDFLSPRSIFTSRDGSLPGGSCDSLADGAALDPASCAPAYREAQHGILMSERILNNDLVPRLRDALERAR